MPSSINKREVPADLKDMSPEDREFFQSLANRDVGRMIAAISAGADVEAYHLNKTAPAFSQSGKLPIHLAASYGFTEGVELLVHLGIDVDSIDMNPKTENTALHIATQHRDQFVALLSLGADTEIPNHMGYSGRQVALHQDKQHMPPKPSYGTILGMFDAIPDRDDLSGLKVEDLFRRDEKGLCLMDNPKVLRRIDEVMEAVAKNDRPLRKADFERVIPAEASYLTPKRLPETVKKLGIGVTLDRIGKVMSAQTQDTYLDRIADVGSLGKCVAVLNKQGEQFTQREELVKDGKPAGLLKVAIDKHQMGALFTEANWQGKKHTEMAGLFQAAGQGNHWQVNNYNSLFQQLRAESNTRSGLGR